MTTTPPVTRHRPVDHRTGPAALAAGVLMGVSVGAELVWSVQRPDGSVTSMVGFALYTGLWTLGALALTRALLGLPGRAGRWIGVSGAALLVAFGAVALLTALTTGTPAEESFLLFAFGLLLLVIGSVPLALGLRRSGVAGGWWTAVLVAGAGGLVALGASADPWHDLGLFTFFVAWAALGARLLARGA